MSVFKDKIFTVGLAIFSIAFIVAASALIFNIQSIITEKVFGITWFDVTLILFIISHWTVIARLIKLYGDFP